MSRHATATIARQQAPRTLLPTVRATSLAGSSTGSSTGSVRAAPRRVDGSRLDMVTIGLLLAVAWSHTFVEMAYRWFPGWRDGGSWMTRLTIGDSYYAHAPIVPVASVLIAWFIHRRVGLPVGNTRRSTIIGWAACLTGLTVHLLSVYAHVTFTSGLALVGTLYGLILLLGGLPLMRAYWVPVALLVFMVPLPLVWIADINYELKSLACSAAVGMVNGLFHIPAVVVGSCTHLAPDAAETGKTLIIDNVCGGLRSLYSLLWFASLFAVLCRLKRRWRWLPVVLAPPIAVGCNVLRFTMLIAGSHYLGTQAARSGGALHQWAGLAAFAAAIGVLLSLECAVAALARRFRRNWTEAGVLGFAGPVQPCRHSGPHTPARCRPALIVTIFIAAAGSVAGSSAASGARELGIARGSVPLTLTLDTPHASTFVGKDMDRPKNAGAARTSDSLRRRYFNPIGGETFDLLIVFSSDNRRAMHPPEVCLEGAGRRIVHKDRRRVPAAPGTGAGAWPMNELITERETQSTLHWYTYKSGGQYTTSYARQQASVVWNGLTGRDAGAALVRLSVPIEQHDVSAARRLAVAAARAVLPYVDGITP